jgi:hypothetical protein
MEYFWQENLPPVQPKRAINKLLDKLNWLPITNPKALTWWPLAVTM